MGDCPWWAWPNQVGVGLRWEERLKSGVLLLASEKQIATSTML